MPMVAFAFSSATYALPDLPRDVSSSTRWVLIAGVLVVHAVVATLVALTSRHPAQVGEVPTISVSLLTQAPSGELIPAAPPVVAPAPTVSALKPAVTTAAPALTSPAVVAVAAPAQAHDMLAPVAPGVVDNNAPADAPVVAAAAPQVAAASSVAVDSAAVVAPSRPVQLSHTAVRYLKKVEPVFPKMSARLGEYGSVTVSVVVDDHGLPVSASVARSSGYPRLDAAARDAVMQSRYVPYTLNGVPQRFEVQAPVSFTPPTE